ncbi:MAG: hypothetical protein GY856_10305 [bacterium]|nr:hypothetical protein [bacterium]
MDRFVIRAEYVEEHRLTNALLPSDIGTDTESFYAQFGFHATQKLRLYAQYENKIDNIFSESIEVFSRVAWREYAVAVNYAFSPNIVLKAETHFVDLIETFSFVGVVPTPQGPRFLVGIRPAEDGRYTIVSLSVSF